jgi:glycosyltransferase involved in cell wall biosynthesis
VRILQLSPGLARRHGGPAVTVVESSRALQALGHEVTILSPDIAYHVKAKGNRATRPEDLPRGAEELDVRLMPVRQPRRLAFSPEIDRELAREVPRHDVVHIHSLFLFPHFSAFRHARRHGVPHIVSPSGALDPYLRPHNRALKRATGLLWQDAMLRTAAAIHYKTDKEREAVADLELRPPAVVAPNGIDWDSFQDLVGGDAFRAEHLGGAQGPIVLNVGRLSEKKGLDILIRAVARLPRDAGVRLVLAGPDDEGLGPALRRLVDDLDLGGRVFFTGMLDGDALRAGLAAADVWALPSHSENFGLAVAEALAAGLPTVISPGVNLARDAEAAGAVLVAPTEPEPLADALASVLGDAELRRRLSDGARVFARGYDWTAVAPRWVAMYEGVMDGRPADGSWASPHALSA